MKWTLTQPDGRQQVVTFVAHYDNSAANRDNPNPNVWVRPGNQAWEEMMVPFTWLVVDIDVNDRDVTAPSTRGDGA